MRIVSNLGDGRDHVGHVVSDEMRADQTPRTPPLLAFVEEHGWQQSYLLRWPVEMRLSKMRKDLRAVSWVGNTAILLLLLLLSCRREQPPH